MENQKSLSLGPQHLLFEYVYARILKNLLPYLKSPLLDFSGFTVSYKSKNLGLKMCYLRVLGSIFKKLLP